MKAKLIGVLCVAVLAGCSPVAAEPPSSTAASGIVASSATPSPEPSSSAQPELSLSQLVLSADGLGPIRMGEAVPADAGVAVLDANYCDIRHPDSGHGGWVPNYPLTPEQGNYPFFLESADAAVLAPVVSIAIGSDEIRTAEGLGVGSTVAELSAAYGAAIVTIPTDNAIAHVVQGTSGQLVFWGTDVVDGAEVIALSAAPVFNYTLMCH